jgi:hypothetical protein
MKGSPTIIRRKTVQNLEAMAGMMPHVHVRNSGSARIPQQSAPTS